MTITRPDYPSPGAQRSYWSDTMTIAASAHFTGTGGLEDYPGVIDLRELAGLDIYAPASFQGNIAFYVSDLPDGTFAPKYKHDNTLLEITVTAGRWYAAPPELFAAHFVKLWSESSGSDQSQTDPRTLQIMAKS